MALEKHYKTRELAELLGIHPETIGRAARRGEIESVRAGMDRLFPESAVKRWLDRSRETERVVSLDRRRKTRASTPGRKEAR